MFSPGRKITYHPEKKNIFPEKNTNTNSSPELEFLNKMPNPGILESRDLR
jgi:hypothetical protein